MIIVKKLLISWIETKKYKNMCLLFKIIICCYIKMMLNYRLPEIEFSTKKEKLKYFVDREEKIKQLRFSIEYDISHEINNKPNDVKSTKFKLEELKILIYSLNCAIKDNGEEHRKTLREKFNPIY